MAWNIGLLGATAAPAGAYELISSTILTSSPSTVTFFSIPQDFKHLQIRWVARSTSTFSDAVTLLVKLNNFGDGGNPYRAHHLLGNGSSVSSQSQIDAPVFLSRIPSNGAAAGNFGAGVIDILDYSSDIKLTTVRSLSGMHNPTTTRDIRLSSFFHPSLTAPVNRLDFEAQNFQVGSRLSLYGIRGE